MPSPSCCGRRYAGGPLGPIGSERHRAPSPRRKAPWLEAKWPESRLFGPRATLHALSWTTLTSSRTSLARQSGTATPCSPPPGRGRASQVHFRGKTRPLQRGQRARSPPSDCRQTGQASLRDILTSLRALAGGHYQAPRPTVPTAPNASAPTLLEKTKIRHLATGSRAGDVLGRLLP